MSRTWVSTVALISIVVGALLAPLQVGAVEGGGSPNGGLRVRAEGDAVTIRWVTLAGGQVDAAADLPKMAVGGYLLPMQTIAVRLAPGAQAAVASLDVESRPWLGTLQPALQETPPALGWEPIPSMLPKVEGSLPHAPVFVLRQGRLRGVAIAIVAFSPIFQDPAGGALRQVDEMEARIDQATPVPALDALVAERMAAGTGPEAAAAPMPSNPLAGGAALKIFVTQAGIQQVGVAELAAAGFADPAADRLRLFWRGVEIPLEIVDENDNGVLDAPEDALRFYAGQPRDRWNPSSWLLDLDLDVHAGRQVELGQRVHRLRAGVVDVEQALVGAELELLAALLVHVRAAQHRPALDLAPGAGSGRTPGPRSSPPCARCPPRPGPAPRGRTP